MSTFTLRDLRVLRLEEALAALELDSAERRERSSG